MNREAFAMQAAATVGAGLIGAGLIDYVLGDTPERTRRAGIAVGLGVAALAVGFQAASRADERLGITRVSPAPGTAIESR